MDTTKNQNKNGYIAVGVLLIFVFLCSILPVSSILPSEHTRIVKLTVHKGSGEEVSFFEDKGSLHIFPYENIEKVSCTIYLALDLAGNLTEASIVTKVHVKIIDPDGITILDNRLDWENGWVRTEHYELLFSKELYISELKLGKYNVVADYDVYSYTPTEGWLSGFETLGEWTFSRNGTSWEDYGLQTDWKTQGTYSRKIGVDTKTCFQYEYGQISADYDLTDIDCISFDFKYTNNEVKSNYMLMLIDNTQVYSFEIPISSDDTRNSGDINVQGYSGVHTIHLQHHYFQSSRTGIITYVWLDNLYYKILATQTFGALAGGGRVSRGGMNYWEVHGNPVGTSLDDYNFWMDIGQVQKSDDSYDVYRSFVHFDTATLPDDTLIVNAYMKILGYTGGDQSAEDFGIEVHQGYAKDRPHFPIDYGDYGIANYTGVSGGNWHTSQWDFADIEMELNPHGISWIRTDNQTKFALMSHRDLGGQIPVYAVQETVLINSPLSENRPTLTVTFVYGVWTDCETWGSETVVELFLDITTYPLMPIDVIVEKVVIPIMLIFLPAFLLLREHGWGGFVIGLSLGVVLAIVIYELNIGLILLIVLAIAVLWWKGKG